jgi:lysophospholipase L1-like esterase
LRLVTPEQPAESPCRLGLLAFGDSITNGGGELQWGVALQSWAMWVARALGLPLTNYAADGALVGDVLERQIPAFEQRDAHPGARYELGCLYIGVNDVRGFDWDPRRFEQQLRRALAFLVERCDRALSVTAPLDLGRPRAGAKVGELDAVIERVASELGALVLDLRDFAGRNVVMTDHVHPTAFGQIAIAERALDVLARDGLRAAVRPSSLISYETTWRHRLRSDCTYAFRHLKVSARAAAILAGLRLGLIDPSG